MAVESSLGRNRPTANTARTRGRSWLSTWSPHAATNSSRVGGGVSFPGDGAGTTAAGDCDGVPASVGSVTAVTGGGTAGDREAVGEDSSGVLDRVGPPEAAPGPKAPS